MQGHWALIAELLGKALGVSKPLKSPPILSASLHLPLLQSSPVLRRVLHETSKINPSPPPGAVSRYFRARRASLEGCWGHKWGWSWRDLGEKMQNGCQRAAALLPALTWRWCTCSLGGCVRVTGEKLGIILPQRACDGCTRWFCCSLGAKMTPGV